MPLHAYTCTECEDQFEEIQKFSDEPLQTCEKCGGSLEKRIGSPSFHLKGGGWYSDGYGSKKNGADVVKRSKEKLISGSD